MSLGFWILAATAVPAVAAALVASIVTCMALRGSEPRERPAILRELAGVFTALSFRRPGPRRVGNARIEDNGDDGSAAR